MMHESRAEDDLFKHVVDESTEQVYFFKLESENDPCDFQVSRHPDPWGAPNQFTVQLEMKPDRVVAELGVWNGVDDDGHPIRNKYWVDKESGLMKEWLKNDDDFREMISALAADVYENGLIVRYVAPVMLMSMDDAVLEFGSGFKEYIESVGTRIPA